MPLYTLFSVVEEATDAKPEFQSLPQPVKRQKTSPQDPSDDAGDEGQGSKTLGNR